MGSSSTCKAEEEPREPSNKTMAQRRMTSLEVIDTDAFLDMPVSCQNLYFHLNARADDDGFVASPKKVVRALSASGDDLKVLIAKKFIIEFEDGVCVIKHWRVNNFIRKDIYKETQYLDLKQTLFIRPNGAYTTNGDERAVPVPSGHFKLEAVESALTQRQLRIGKGREGESSETEDGFRGQEDSIVPFKEEQKSKDGNTFTKKYNELCDWMENLTGTRFVDRRGQFRALKLAREGDISMERLKERSEELWHSGKFEKDGMDWFNVVYSFNKKA